MDFAVLEIPEPVSPLGTLTVSSVKRPRRRDGVWCWHLGEETLPLDLQGPCALRLAVG